MEPVTFAPKDTKIIRDNPGKSPYELKELGLSNAAFDKLMSQPSTGIVVQADPSLSEEEQQPPAAAPAQSTPPPFTPLPSPIVTTDEEKQPNTEPAVIIPKITTLQEQQPPVVAPILKKQSDQVVVRTPTGVQNTMGREFATKLAQQDPRYKIIG